MAVRDAEQRLRDNRTGVAPTANGSCPMPTFPYFNYGYSPGELEYLNSERDEPMTKQVIVGDEQAISPEGSGIPLVQGTTEDPDERSGHPATENAAVTFLNEILDYFQNENRDPGGDWAFPDDFSSLCLDYRDRHETKFWLDIERDGTIRVFWKPRGGPMKAMDFVGETSAVSGDRTGADANSAGSVNQSLTDGAKP